MANGKYCSMNWKPGRWGSPLVQNYQEERACDSRQQQQQHDYNNKDLTMEIQRMWNVKTKVIPVIIGATGTISKSFRKYVSNIPGNHEGKELQKTAMLGTAHILRKVLT
jgi:hypothetical protein